MAQWYASKSGQQQGPISLDELHRLLAMGDIGPGDLVWNESLPNWVSASDVPELTGSLPAGEVRQLGYQSSFGTNQLIFTDRAVDMLRQTRPWVRLISILMFIAVGFGGLVILVMLIAFIATFTTGGNRSFEAGFVLIMGLLQSLAVLLYLIPAVYLWRYGSRIGQLVIQRREDHAEAALEAQKSFWKFVGIMILIAIGLWVLMMAGSMLIAMR